ncbi:ATP-binding protein [Subdoligranulum variabile]|uniref:histidine kinase n=1 Tax=Subdoligranulum variabile DSM 15176 TaxID=411471 RepID=D1PMA4_9FIRM|nr:ATP-binding protein [Subdoligranulum variabile]EFB75689.1 ATPase/histidine kinase/DNA gyrase B/HSP90 domain protein [Subdoligranulum variabile DSM 15176]UWP68390.1 ATP-binding protein [Subdoligranulum variabile]
MTLLRNLVLNAAADTGGNGIRIWSQGDRRKIHIEVTDCGSGISEEKVEKIKEPFYRIDKSRSREAGGSGLGLTTCEQIIIRICR